MIMPANFAGEGIDTLSWRGPSKERTSDVARTRLMLAPVVRRVSTSGEYRQCEHLQERIWGPEGVARVPLLDLLTAQENGGLVLGAFSGDLLVGFVFSFLGMDSLNRLKHCSVVLAVDSNFRGHGIGRRLKLAQRDEALAQGIGLITWTYDPLLALNANLNIRRLGAVSRTYSVNHYDTERAPMPGLDSVGLDTDRLIVEWDLRKDPGQAAADDPSPAVRVADVAVSAGLPCITAMDLDVDAATVLVPVPADMARVRSADLKLARRWRYLTRTLFQTYFQRGYTVVGFDATADAAGTAWYRLRRDVVS